MGQAERDSSAAPAAGPTASALAWGTASAMGTGVGVAYLYRAMGVGRLGVVVPPSDVGAVAHSSMRAPSCRTSSSCRRTSWLNAPLRLLAPGDPGLAEAIGRVGFAPVAELCAGP
ncbi:MULTISPECIES: hypothetical protein [unclassified Nocardiopsis]|uniref:hypothetical protein n=1 Tax=Nocardiopsis TaxID=2013 RepID=UPI00387AFAA1